MDYYFILRSLEPNQNQIFQIMEDKVNKEKAIDETVKIIQDFQYNDELSQKYKIETLGNYKINAIPAPYQQHYFPQIMTMTEPTTG